MITSEHLSYMGKSRAKILNDSINNLVHLKSDQKIAFNLIFEKQLYS